MMSCIACNEPASEVKAPPGKEAAAEIFPVSFFFRQQIKEVDSLGLPTVKYSITGNRKDTVAISIEEFKALAREFIESDISKPPLRDQYKETNFADQSIPSITLTYATANAQLPVQRIDVILDPNPVVDDKVKTIYIEKKETANDTLIYKKLYWKSDKNFQVITSKTTAGKKEMVSQVKVAWDNSD